MYYTLLYTLLQAIGFLKTFCRHTLVSGGEDALIKIWSRKSGKLLKILDHHTYISEYKTLAGSSLFRENTAVIQYLEGFNKGKILNAPY